MEGEAVDRGEDIVGDDGGDKGPEGVVETRGESSGDEDGGRHGS